MKMVIDQWYTLKRDERTHVAFGVQGTGWTLEGRMDSSDTATTIYSGAADEHFVAARFPQMRVTGVATRADVDCEGW